MHENVTTAHAVALSCLRPTGAAPPHRLLGDGFPVDDLSVSRAAGGRLRADGRSGGRRSHRPTPIASSTRSTSTTAVVAFSHVLFRTSYIMDAAAIVAARARGRRPVILDTYQSAGIIPVDVTALGRRLRGRRMPEVAVRRARATRFSTRGPSCADSVRPAFTGWLSHRHPFAFDIDAIEDRARRCDADDERHAVDSGVLRGAGGARHHPRGRRRSHSRRSRGELTARLLDARRPVRLHVRGVARSRAAGRHGRRQRPRRAAGGAHAEGARLRRRLPAAGRHPACRRISTTRWTRSIG